MISKQRLDQLCVNAIRMLAADAVQRAGSGHPGMPMGAAAMAYVLWTRFLKHNPANPRWLDRDRFVLSPGHGSMLLYSLLHLAGYGLPLEELTRFRQWGSRTPGHPEHGLTPGVEATTGPLGQGFANGVGMAVAERYLACAFNRPGLEIVDHYTYAIVSDGDLMEGVSAEAASLAGTWKLGKLIYLYDDNEISIEGSTDLAFTESVGRRFEAYGWHVQHVDGNDLDGVDAAIRAAQAEVERPSLIVARTHIGFGSPGRQDTAKAHGEPLGEEELRATKEALGWPAEPPFFVPPEALAHFRQAVVRGAEAEAEWARRVEEHVRRFPEEAGRWRAMQEGELPSGWEAGVPEFTPADGSLATRAASGRVLNGLADKVPALVGGSADLAPSTSTYLKGYGDLGLGEWCARNMRFGVREHAMGAIVNGMALHGGIIPYAATFLAFSDYMRPAIRLAALTELRVIFIFTHDSIGLGEDGPTHQPVEQLLSLRAIPGLVTLRPADATETAEAWRVALQRHGPTALILSRQALPVLDRAKLASAAGVARGAYVLADSAWPPELILIASGSEVHIALEAQRILGERGIGARVVSMPSWELFDGQPAAYRAEVLPPSVSARVAIEAGRSLGWSAYVGDRGTIIALDRFGASAPAAKLFEAFGFTPKQVAARAATALGR